MPKSGLHLNQSMWRAAQATKPEDLLNTLKRMGMDNISEIHNYRSHDNYNNLFIEYLGDTINNALEFYRIGLNLNEEQFWKD